MPPDAVRSKAVPRKRACIGREAAAKYGVMLTINIIIKSGPIQAKVMDGARKN